ncbi:PhzF family phenazine biosynthesis protein [Legionella sp. km772]|uniref:PhzF family phenazine biosynthesis protein n=1 Tax=Legionella sp. km772 TaxID=2498111 RepID=UPI000F8DF788|nr:PhzF family phenazine biosynthesis protein [Legionella sp. km772]RUR12215.1 PhzF family phenazine biosynthesis protein [Legionella sp. km772]
MDSIEIFQIDAFTDKVFHGNPAAVCLLTDWLNDELMQAIAAENNLSETAFVLEDKNGYYIRWFTPNGEISLCGHATLAAGFALLELGKCEGPAISFHSLSGMLSVERNKDKYTLDFPRLNYLPSQASEHFTSIIDQPIAAFYESDLDYLCLLEHETQVQNAQIDFIQLKKLPKRGLIITSTSTNADFYSRCFYPKHGIMEDSVTGSAHCVLTPFWVERLNKTALHAIQGSQRKGELFCELKESRVAISGYCRWYLKGHIVL